MATITFVFIFVFFYLPHYSCSLDMMSVLWDQEESLRKVLTGDYVPDRDTNAVVKRLFQLPFTEELKSDAWFKLLRYRSAENWGVDDWQKFEALIPSLPVIFLRSVNVTNELVLQYFGQLRFEETKLSQVAEIVMERLGCGVLKSARLIVKLRNILCGFPLEYLLDIKPDILRYLLNTNFFHSIKGCDVKHLRILVKNLQHHMIIGPPRTWTPDTVKSIGDLVAGLKPPELRQIRDNTFSHLTPDVIELTPAHVLKEVRKSQLLALNRSSLLAWRRKTKDLRQLYSGSENLVYSTKTCLFLIWLCMETI